HTSSQKMSILYAEKSKPVVDGEGVEVNDGILQYPVFLANVTEPESAAGNVCEWLEPRLNIVLEEWKKWQTENHLSALDESLLTDAYESSNITQAKKKLLKKDDRQIPLSLEEPVQTKKPKPVKSEVSISKTLDELFKKK
ncbi:MAG: hypothetical protein AAB017_00610, partial [Nitrospirota bacterium]